MDYEQELGTGERELERQLAGLVPAGHRIHRDRVMFQAGLRVADRGLRRWRWSTLLLWLVGIGCGWWMASREPGASWVANQPPEPEPTPEPVTASVGPLPRPSEGLAYPTPRGAVYLLQRDRLIREGPDALPSYSSAGLAAEPIKSLSDGWPRHSDRKDAVSHWRWVLLQKGNRS